ncbi:hypothetical protein ACH5RR_021868 [Cinchona calisaya]|uniref:Uncharacterized protein n=1 Tax=Cinchona calisaya TaxID=153742 RepID=A0ABD2Z652_9GENT
MESKVAAADQAEKNSRPRRDNHLRPHSRGGSGIGSGSGINQKAILANMFETIAREIVFEEGGVTRMKILVKKEHLKQVVDAMRSNGCKTIYVGNNVQYSSPSSVSSLEQRLNFMRKRQLSRSSQITKRVSSRERNPITSWKPALQSIPEEL